MLQRTVEDEVANRILRGTAQPGNHVVLDVSDISHQPLVADIPATPTAPPQ